MSILDVISELKKTFFLHVKIRILVVGLHLCLVCTLPLFQLVSVRYYGSYVLSHTPLGPP